MRNEQARVQDGTLNAQPDAEHASVAVGSAEWFRWLEQPEVTAFRYLQGVSQFSFSARRESRRGQQYWYAYRRYRGRLHKRYLGRSADLTPELLAAAAARFASDLDIEDDLAIGRAAQRWQASEKRHNMPALLTSFLGRETEIARVGTLLDSARLVTLTGPGGIGKTRLALRIAESLLDHGVDAVWLVELDRVNDPALVPQAVALAAGVREEPGAPLLETLATALGVGQVLLVLDNCEHLGESCAAVVDVLLRECPHLRILATSRELLGVPGEITWLVPSLEFGAAAIDGQQQADAIQLFAARAGAARPDFALTPENTAAVIEICRRLEGIPLAIELAASGVRMFSPADIAVRLQTRLDVPGNNRAGVARHRTLAAASDWSYQLLTASEQRSFERLAVFAGGFTLDAAEAVCSDGDIAADAVPGLLARLVDCSLVIAEPCDDGDSTRFRLLETLRAYAGEKLDERGELKQTRHRHALWFSACAAAAAGAFKGPDQGRWLRWAERERDNVRTALSWAVQSGVPDLAVRLAADYSWPWLVHGRWSEGLEWTRRVLAMPQPGLTRERCMLLIGAVQLAIFRGDLASNRPTGDLAPAVQWIEECARIAEVLGDDWLQLAVSGIAELFREFGSEVAGVPALTPEQGLAAARQVGDPWGERRALEAAARAALRMNDGRSARALLQEAADSAQRDGDTWSLALALNELGDVERAASRHAHAKSLYEESAALFVALGLGEQPNLLHNLGYVALAMGDFGAAKSRFTRALTQFRRSGERRGMAECLIGFGALAAAEQRPTDAAGLFGAGEAALASLGYQLWPANQPDYGRWLTRAKSTRSLAEFDRAWREGQATPLPVAVTSLLDGTPLCDPSLPAVDARLPLTRREREVASLAAQGLTNRQVGAALHIAEKTAANHLQRVLEKLDLRSRAQLAAQAARLGLNADIPSPKVP